MTITIVGASGQIARLLHPKLIEKGHSIRGIIRNPEQAKDLIKLGVNPIIADVEQMDDISEPIGNADAVIFAAGAGPGSGAARKWAMDRDGAIKLIEAAKKNRIKRYLMISAMGLETPRGNEVFQAYQQAKAETDEALRNSDLDYTIVKPGRLTNDPGAGKISIGKSLDRGEITREDVASVLAEVLEMPKAIGKEFDLLSGSQPIQKALEDFLVS